MIATAHRTVKPSLPATVDVRLGRSDEAGSDQRGARRCVTVGHRSPGGVHSADVLRQPRAGPGGERRRDRHRWCAPRRRCRRRLASSTRRAWRCMAAATRTGSPTCSPPKPRRWRRNSMAATSWKPKTSCAHRIWSGRSFGSPASSRLEPLVDYGDFDSFYFGAIMPEDHRCHSVDSRDVAAAFAAAITTEACGRSS